MKTGRLLAVLILGMLIFTPYVSITQEPTTTRGTSPLGDSEIISVQEDTISPQNSETITFSEYPINTLISDQYAGQGIIFGGDNNPFISTDSSNPTSPVLSGSPKFRGAIEGAFVNPSDGTTPVIVESFTLDAGFFDEFGSTRIEWFDPNGIKLGQRTNLQFGIEKIEVTGGNIASWRTSILLTEPNGYAIDNFSFEPAKNSVVFRENAPGFPKAWLTDVPGFDHIGLNVDNRVYESHPGYKDEDYQSEDGTETEEIDDDNGVQGQHTKGTFAYDNGKKIEFEEIPIDKALAETMREKIKTQLDVGYPQDLVDRDNLSFGELLQKLAPATQKNRDGNGTFTCVGLIEWAAEEAGHNFGQGFIFDVFEAIGVVPLLSPQLLNYSLKFSQVLDDVDEWFQGLLDPVDFMITDPLGRRLGYTAALGEINEIPNAFYSGDGEVEQFLIPYPVPGEYQVTLIGLDAQVNGAVASSKSSEDIDVYLTQGEEITTTSHVFMYVGSPGDVNQDGCIDDQDVTAISPLLNTFTNTPKHPADIDGDGLIAQSDVVLLNQLVLRNLCVRQIFLPIILKDYSLGSTPSQTPTPIPTNTPTPTVTPTPSPTNTPATPNNPPNTLVARKPVPDATNVAITDFLRWIGGDPDPDDTVTYEVYLDANNSNPSTLLVCNNPATFTCSLPDPLLHSTDYYWKVVATDNHGATTTSDIWKFRTVDPSPTCNTPDKPILISPPDGTIFDSRATGFQWQSVNHANKKYFTLYGYNGSVIGTTVSGNSTGSATFGFAGTRYWRVRGLNDIGSCNVYGPWSDEWSVTIETP